MPRFEVELEERRTYTTVVDASDMATAIVAARVQWNEHRRRGEPDHIADGCARWALVESLPQEETVPILRPPLRLEEETTRRIRLPRINNTKGFWPGQATPLRRVEL